MIAIGATVAARLVNCGGRTALLAGLVALAIEGLHRYRALLSPG